MNDTDPRVDAVYRRMLMAKSGEERVRMACSMHATAKAIALASLRASHPKASEAELRGLLFLRFYREDFTEEQRQKIHEHLIRYRPTGRSYPTEAAGHPSDAAADD